MSFYGPHSVQKAPALWFCRVIQCGSPAWFFGLCEDSLSLLGSAVCSYTPSVHPPIYLTYSVSLHQMVLPLWKCREEALPCFGGNEKAEKEA